MADPDRLAFSIDLLANAADQPRPMTVCRHGHLQVAGRTCWKPVSFADGLRAVLCELVDPHD